VHSEPAITRTAQDSPTKSHRRGVGWDLTWCVKTLAMLDITNTAFLGPTAFGRIPGFTKHIFPEESRSYLSLVANIGLILFLFLVGLEIDSGVIKRNARLSATIALAGMILPFGIGAGVAHALYEKFIDPSIKFTYFMLFAGVAYSITAFPVLCRILTELKLLDTTVGIVVLSAGVGNDISKCILAHIFRLPTNLSTSWMDSTRFECGAR